MSVASADLDRFVAAQADVYGAALAELRRGRKESHWMWFVFPQIVGLGHSAMSHHYAIRSLGEASAYLAHPVLGPRLAECTDTVLGHDGTSAEWIFGAVDAAKFRSSMTLFEAAGAAPRFALALDAFFGGERDQPTLRLLA
ncbi:MAG TPA: DUF1810 domain-containing protein [Allosphingosinicella sp.]|jgi:uncharacterized protein (DUF1810 family)